MNRYEDKALNAVRFYKAVNLIEATNSGKRVETPGSGPLRSFLPLVTAKPLNVLDFGGGFAVSYFLARRWCTIHKWAVVDTPIVAAMGAALATDRLQFFTSILAARAWLDGVTLVHTDSAIQYTGDPVAALYDLVDVNAPYMMLLRGHFGKGMEMQKSQLISQYPGPLPASIPNRWVEYPRWAIPRATFDAVLTDYQQEAAIEPEHFFYRRKG